MTSSKFTHLHVHTEYSLLDGLSNIKKLFTHVKNNDMDAVAITDHGAMYGAVDFFKEGQKSGIKPIIGLEAYTTASMEEKIKDNYHLTLLAKNYEGYVNLMRLTSIANMDGYYYRPRFTKEILEKHKKGIIVLSGCPAAEVPQYLINGELKKAKKTTQWFQSVFGTDYYMEIQRHDYSNIIPTISNEELKVNLQRVADNSKIAEEGVVKLSRELGIPLVATNDAHYVEKRDAPAQDALVCIATGKNISDIKRMRYIDNPDFYLKTPSEMEEQFPDFPDALENSVKIADKCIVEIPLGKWYFPKFKLPKGKTDDAAYLRELVYDRIADRVGKLTKEVKERVEYELEIICGKGYAAYFLIVMDIVDWAAENGIVTNTRGSAAGSLVSFVLGVTTVNPLTYNLPFERFLNPYRPSPPDIDFDISDNRREDVINYMANKYGVEKTAQICTFGRMLARGAVRDMARVLGYEYSIGDKISKLIPLGAQGFPMTIQKALDETPELKQLYDNDADTKKILDLSREVEGSARHISVHAAGLVISPGEITKFTPIQKEPKGKKTITQYEMHACEDVGLIKFDILGIRNLAILGSAIQIIKDRRGKTITLHNIPIDGSKHESARKTFEMLSRGETMGTFQMGGSGMTKFLKELKPERVEDIMAMLALYRPGPITVIPEYIARKNNPKLVKYLDPRMEKYLDKSYGLIVYQDDLLFSAIDLAGYSWEEADKFRKAVGKKIPEEMAAQKEKFQAGIVENGQTKKFAEDLWLLFEPFQSYGFNKAHAAAYGMVAYYTSYLKANYPVEYMTALLTAESNDSDKISLAINECRKMNIKVLPPDINQSDTDFTIVDDKDSLDNMAIRFGISAIKHVGEAAIEAILEAREKENFSSLIDLLTRSDGRRVNKKVLESLIKVGALSEFGKRSQLLSSLDDFRAKIVKPKHDNGQEGLFSADVNKKTSGFVSDSALLDTTLPEFSKEELENLERELLGFSLTARPLGELLGDLIFEATHNVSDLDPESKKNQVVKIAGVIKEVRQITTKKSGAEMAFVKIEDPTGIVDLVVFPKIYESTKEAWVEGKPLLVEGKLDSREEQVNILVESIQTEVQKQATIKIPKEVTPDQLKMLRAVFEENPGDKEVMLFFEKNKKRVKPKMKINWSETLSLQIKDILD
ncbi:DNA polymerase III subunit alpha [Candidatus Microgenomates bacterium]|nr:DNA polymerase III subunit alpha [Candidatus Microgenomates bacterium]